MCHIEKQFGVEVGFGSKFTESEEKIMINELQNAIRYVFNRDKFMGEVKAIIVTREYDNGNGKMINGCFTHSTKGLFLGAKYINDIPRFRNIICHELTHAKFVHRLNSELSELKKRNDRVVYFIDEYMACKVANDYSYSIEELEHYITKVNFNKYYSKRKYNITYDEVKELASLVSMIIVSSDILGLEIKEKDVRDIAEQLRKIDFIPTSEEYDSLKNLLKNKGFRCIED